MYNFSYIYSKVFETITVLQTKKYIRSGILDSTVARHARINITVHTTNDIIFLQPDKHEAQFWYSIAFKNTVHVFVTSLSKNR